MTEEQQLAAFKVLDDEFAAAGGKDLMRSDPNLFRKFIRRADRLGPLSNERVGEIMRAMRNQS